MDIGNFIYVDLPPVDCEQKDPTNLIRIVFNMKDGKYGIGAKLNRRKLFQNNLFYELSISEIPTIYSNRALVRQL